MTRNILRNETCLISVHEPITMKDTIEHEDWIQAMNEEIDQIENNKTWSLISKP